MGLWRYNFARRLQAWQRRSGWSSIQLAVRSGLSRNYLTRLKQGMANPSLKVICHLAEAFDRDPGELVGTPRKDEKIREALKKLEMIAEILPVDEKSLPQETTVGDGDGDGEERVQQAYRLAEEGILDLKEALGEEEDFAG